MDEGFRMQMPLFIHPLTHPKNAAIDVATFSIVRPPLVSSSMQTFGYVLAAGMIAPRDASTACLVNSSFSLTRKFSYLRNLCLTFELSSHRSQSAREKG